MIEKAESGVYRLVYDVPVKGVPAANGYLIMADQPVLVDGGASDDATYKAFIDDLATLKLAPRDLGAVLVTHNHLDHIGLPSRLAKEVTIPIHVHEDEWYMVTANEEKREEFRRILRDTFVYWGVPEQVLLAMHSKLMEVLRFGGGIAMDRVVPYPKEKFSVCGVGLEAIHCPGHTDGLVCLWWNEQKSIFSNDQVLETISPNPTIYMKPRNGRRCGLGDYLESLSNVENLPARTVYPGHGHSFSNLSKRIGEIRALASERREQVLRILREEPAGASILDITQKIWKSLDPIQTFLGAREVHGIVEILTDAGVVGAERRGKIGVFRLRDASAEVTREIG